MFHGLIVIHTFQADNHDARCNSWDGVKYSRPIVLQVCAFVCKFYLQDVSGLYVLVLWMRRIGTIIALKSVHPRFLVAMCVVSWYCCSTTQCTVRVTQRVKVLTQPLPKRNIKSWSQNMIACLKRPPARYSILRCVDLHLYLWWLL